MKSLKVKLFTLALAAVFSLALGLTALAHNDEQHEDESEVNVKCDSSTLYCPTSLASAELAQTIESVKAPKLQAPVKPVASPAPASSVITYQVVTKGKITASLSEFKTQANQTLNDARGWAKMGVSFTEVTSGGSFTLVLAAANQVPTYAAICDSTYSCQAGRYVVINQDRWLGATPSWNNAGGSLRDYRHMVVNHEVGHWLGHGHASCSGKGKSAAVMQQQSINLSGCKFNPWPLASELWSSRLGI